MSMFDNDSYNDGVNAGKRIAIGCLVASIAVFAILALTFSSNRKPRQNKDYTTSLKTVSAGETRTHEEAVHSNEGNKRTSDELSFWNMYDRDEKEETVISSDGGRKEKPLSGKEEVLRELSRDAAEKERKEKELKNSFNISREGEEPEMIAISRALSLNELDKDGFYYNGDRLFYESNGKTISHFGIDVSKNNGDIDWKKVKEDGVEFAMLKVGSRGYSTGKIILDENLQKNIEGCSQNGIQIGAYFFSQAVTKVEAVEEANYVVAALSKARVDYPVVFDSEAVENDSYRTQNLSAQGLTECAAAFCEVIRAYGYMPMIAGTKKQLVKRMDLSQLYGYGFWLFDTDEECVYPYRYAMRQYSNDGAVDGINGRVSMDICLISYSER